MSPPRACLRAPEEFHRFYLSADQANLSLQLPLPLSSSATSPTYRKVNGIKGSAALNDEESRLPKVPIPRAVHSVNAVTTGRVDQACQPCREQKAKCSGHRPKCRRCEENSLFCIYEDRKRARTTKQLDHLGSQVRAYEALLRQLYPKLGFEDANHVDHIFGSKSDDRRPLEKDRLAPSQDPAHQLHENDYHNNYNVSLFAVVADCTTEDYNQKGGMQAMGYVGDHSGIKWLYRLKHHLDDAYPNSNVQGNSHDCSDLPNISSANYYLDDLKLQFPDDVDISRRPPREIADQLVTAYFGLTHIFFAFVRKDIFLSQYRSFYSNHAPKPGRKWLALFNLVLAISAEQAYKLKKDSRPKLPADRECNAPNMFFGRAWHLAMTDSLLEPSNLQQVQVEALASLYLLSAGHANRAWKLCGVAMRSAVMLGLHLRSESDIISPLSKESRYQLWWALQLLETELSAMIGRPLSTDTAFCTTPSPSPCGDMDYFEERPRNFAFNMANEIISGRNELLKSSDSFLFESQTSPALSLRPISQAETLNEPNPPKAGGQLMDTESLYFTYAIQLNHVMRQAIARIYSTGAQKSQQHLESVIRSLNSSADHWLSSLPSACRFPGPTATDPFDCHRACLALSFYCTKIIILQPCLHMVTYQSARKNCSNPFYDSMATLCIGMAKKAIDVFPDEPDVAWLSASCPWWCALHYLMQSTAILMIALLKRSQISSTDALNVQIEVRKAMRWLSMMSTKDLVARKARNLCQDILAHHTMQAALASKLL